MKLTRLTLVSIAMLASLVTSYSLLSGWLTGCFGVPLSLGFTQASSRPLKGKTVTKCKDNTQNTQNNISETHT